MPDSTHTKGDAGFVPYASDPAWIEQFLSFHPHTEAHAAARERLSAILDSEGEIFPAPDSPLGRLWEILNSEESVIEDCVEVVELDPVLATRVYRAANSMVASSAKANTIYEAVMQLGFAQMRQLVFATGVMKKGEGLKLPEGWDKFWFRSLFVARVTERLAGTFSRTSGTEYLAGLLHDIGWLLMATFFPNQLTLILANAGSDHDIELEILSFTHAEISAAVCARSHIPGRVVSGILHHHHPVLLDMKNVSPSESAMFLGILLNIGDKLADAAGLTMGPETEKIVSIESIENSPEVVWLSTLGKKIELERILREEMTRTTSAFSALFG